MKVLYFTLSITQKRYAHIHHFVVLKKESSREMIISCFFFATLLLYKSSISPLFPFSLSISVIYHSHDHAISTCALAFTCELSSIFSIMSFPPVSLAPFVSATHHSSSPFQTFMKFAASPTYHIAAWEIQSSVFLPTLPLILTITSSLLSHIHLQHYFIVT